ncbi:MAG: S41 family peptidase [Proteobacteria bacterium]|jgi:carboxyl-terminal processing protease|nr:S41 family peptidase [Pseudomonadota bacterium]
MKMSPLRICALAAIALAAAPVGGAEPPADGGDAAHDLARGVVFDRVVLSIMEQYYDPDRAEPVTMLRGALDALERSVAEVKVDYDGGGKKAVVSVLAARHEIDLASIAAPWGLSRAMHGAFGFLAEKLPRDERRDLREIEYAAVNGMLSVLDPHSGAMMPKEWQELRMRLEGEFEGIGIRITTDRRPPCDGDLTVVEVFDDTPAKKAGLRAGDKIVRIGGDSTVNITTDEAADRLRGAHGTKVKIQVKRPDGQLVSMEVARGTIAIESVKWKMLEGGVGYVSLTEFQQDSAAEVAAAVQALRDGGMMKGLVLDVRDNPGGSLDAAGEIADLFLTSGTIVTTAGRHYDDREVRDATAKGTEPPYPLVILVNSFAASAAEVIAGALRNHGRALLIGETTFGKGSVQTIAPLPGEGALRITVAQYLTPGDISIQGVGVAPDVRYAPVTIDREEMNLDMKGPSISERDLDAHLARPTDLDRSDRPGLVTAPLLIPPAERRADLAVFDRCYDADPDRLPYKARRETEIARRIILATSGPTTGELIMSARRLLGEDEAAEVAAVEQALRKNGIDWSAPPSDASPAAKSNDVVSSARLVGKIVPGGKIRISASVKNDGAAPIYRLRAVTASDDPIFDDVEIVFGKVAPGATRKRDAVVELPPVLSGRIDPVTVRFEAAAGPLPSEAAFDAALPATPRARLDYAWHVEDLGNGNGFAEPGEELAIRFWLTNSGDASTFEADAQLSGGPGVDVVKGHVPVGRLAPGKTTSGEMRLRIGSDYPPGRAELRLVVEEWISGRFQRTRSVLERTIVIPVAAASPSPSKAAGTITVKGPQPAALLQVASADGGRVGQAQPGATFPVDARFGSYFRVVLAKDQHAWIAESDTRPGGDGAAAFERAVVRPPVIEIKGGSVRTVRGLSARFEGSAQCAEGVRDLIVFISGKNGDKKAAYVPARGGRPEARLDFSLDLPLAEGANEIVFIARRDADVASSETVFVRATAK